MTYEEMSGEQFVKAVHRKIPLVRHKNVYVGFCPFHKDAVRTFIVSEEGTYACAGCGRTGTKASFMKEFYPEDEAVAVDSSISECLEKTKSYYSWWLKNGESKEAQDALAYLKERELTDETIEKFGLGYAPGSLLSGRLRRLGVKEETMISAGVVRQTERGLKDFFHSRVIFPIIDVNDRCIGFGGRITFSDPDKTTAKYKNSPESEIFHKGDNLFAMNYAKDSPDDHFIVSEGYMDAITMQQAGFSNAVASLGTALTENQCRLLKRYKDRVMLMYDSDDAGIRAAVRAVKLVHDQGLRARIVNLAPFKDPDDFVRAKGREGLLERIRKSEDGMLFLSRNLVEPESDHPYQRAVDALRMLDDKTELAKL